MKIFLSLFLAILLVNIFSLNSSFEELSEESVPLSQELLPSYVIEITTGSGGNYKFQHFYPLNIAVPIGTTVAWFNDDPESVHTATSGTPGSSDSGSLFNSGLIPYAGSMQYTFGKPGLVPYHCEVHPWMVGSVYVSDKVKDGNNIILKSGSDMGSDSTSYDWMFNTTRNDRLLLSFDPVSFAVEKSIPLTYNITMYDDQRKILSQPFVSLGDDLQLELVASNLDDILVYGPDYSDSRIGAYHIRSSLPEGEYKILAEITAYGSNLTQSKIVDEFKGTITS